MIIASKLQVYNSNWWHSSIWYSNNILIPYSKNERTIRIHKALKRQGYNKPFVFFNTHNNEWVSTRVIVNSISHQFETNERSQIERQIWKIQSAIIRAHDDLNRPPVNVLTSDCKLVIQVEGEAMEISKISKRIIRDKLFQPKSIQTKLNQLQIERAPNWRAEHNHNKHLLPQYSDVMWRLSRTALPLGYKMQTWEEVNPNCTYGCPVLERFKHLFYECPMAKHQWHYFLKGWNLLIKSNSRR